MAELTPTWTSPDGRASLYLGDCLEILPTLAAGSVDAVVTDPPAGIGFMGKQWDGDKGGRDSWVRWMAEIAGECIRVSKPGAHALVWALPRTSHWTATAWENAGWEVRDRIGYLFGSGFPKSLDVSKAIDKAAGAERKRHRGVRSGIVGTTFAQDAWSKTYKDSVLDSEPITDAARQWQGWGTALKPACEDWWLLRKPLDGTVAENVQKHRTGGINIDGCRVSVDPLVDDVLRAVKRKPRESQTWEQGSGFKNENNPRTGVPLGGRWPANLIHDGSEEVVDLFPQTKPLGGPARNGSKSAWPGGDYQGTVYPGDSGSAARFFYCAKASRAERGEENGHPTVKPLALMEYLCRLIAPLDSTVLDPFLGSGTTGQACQRLGRRFIGVEIDPEYFEEAKRRIADAAPLFAEA